MEYGIKSSSRMTTAELREEVEYLTEQLREDRIARGLPEEQPEDFVPLAMAWTLYKRCDPLFKFAIRYAQLCDQANEILELTDDQIKWAQSFRKYTDLITKAKGTASVKMLGGSLGGLISVLEKHDEYEAVIELLRPMMLQIGFLQGEYYPPGLHEYVYILDVSKEENDRHSEEVYAEVERLKDEEYFEAELERLTERYNSIKHLY